MTIARLGAAAAGAALTAVLALGPAFAQQPLAVDVNKISSEGVGEKIGTVELSESGGALVLKVAVQGMGSGKHGFHVHENGSCEAGTKDGRKQAGLAAGGHFDPDKTNKHGGPSGSGHKGDLPQIESKDGSIQQTVQAPRLKLADIRGRALVIHESNDNYTDQPENGGSGGRSACAVVPAT